MKQGKRIEDDFEEASSLPSRYVQITFEEEPESQAVSKDHPEAGMKNKMEDKLINEYYTSPMQRLVNSINRYKCVLPGVRAVPGDKNDKLQFAIADIQGQRLGNTVTIEFSSEADQKRIEAFLAKAALQCIRDSAYHRKANTLREMYTDIVGEKNIEGFVKDHMKGHMVAPSAESITFNWGTPKFEPIAAITEDEVIETARKNPALRHALGSVEAVA